MNETGEKETDSQRAFCQAPLPGEFALFGKEIYRKALKNGTISVTMLPSFIGKRVTAMEKTILLTQGSLEIPCKLSVPEDGDVRRIVLGVHGLGGSTMDEIQVGIAEEMELFYSATLRFDFPAHGESPLNSEFFTLPNCLESLLAVARYGREQFPEVEDLCIFATGFGAYVTLVALDDLLDMGQVKLVVQTPSVMMHETLLAMKNLTEPTLKAMGSTSFARLRRPLTISYQFYKDMRDNIVLNSYPIPMLILHGEEDAYINMEYIRQFRRINEESKLVIIPGASHRFLEDGAWDMVLDLTRDWFEFEQVLCCDWE